VSEFCGCFINTVPYTYFDILIGLRFILKQLSLILHLTLVPAMRIWKCWWAFSRVFFHLFPRHAGFYAEFECRLLCNLFAPGQNFAVRIPVSLSFGMLSLLIVVGLLEGGNLS